MNKGTIALISSILTELLRLSVRLAELRQQAEAGEITNEVALQRLAEVQAEYADERQRMDQAIAAARAAAKGAA